MKKLPPFLKQYFWDVDFDKIDPEKKPRYVIARILELGDQKATKWLNQNFSQKEIIEATKNTRELSQKSANFWSIIYQIKPTEIRCLQKSFLEKRKVFWPY